MNFESSIAMRGVPEQRYFAERLPVPKSPAFVDLLNSLNDNRFYQEFRMSKAVDTLDQMLSDDLTCSATGRLQLNSRHQILLTLNRLGTYGNSTSIGCIARKFGVSEESAANYTRRVIKAICKHASTMIVWPSPQERVQISTRVKQAFDIEGCVGFVDGTLFLLHQVPVTSGPDYYSRKGRCGLSGMLVCDDRKKITFMMTGFPGCTHNQLVYDNSPLNLVSSRLSIPSFLF